MFKAASGSMAEFKLRDEGLSVWTFSCHGLILIHCGIAYWGEVVSGRGSHLVVCENMKKHEPWMRECHGSDDAMLRENLGCQLTVTNQKDYSAATFRPRTFDYYKAMADRRKSESFRVLADHDSEISEEA
jgi:hypothetical protein